MVGLCGVLGTDSELPDELTEWVTWRDDERTSSYADDDVELVVSGHPRLSGDQPVFATGEDTLVWVWGDVYGHGSGQNYTPRPQDTGTSASFCAHLYGEHGIDAVEELNGDFALVLYDRTAGVVSFVTDRLGTRPIYYARPDEETFVFASNQQALPQHPDVDVAFQEPYLQEYLALRRVFGVETPLSGVRELQPASVTAIDLGDLTMDETTYWRPHYEPVNRSASWFADRLTETLQTIFEEWTRDDLDYGLLLSGGIDSRLVEACIDQPVTAFHVTDWNNRETRVARHVAETAGDDFHPLYRDDVNEARSLGTTPPLSNFSGWFDQAYCAEFEDEIREEVDVLVSGLFADMLFGGGPIQTRNYSLGPVGNLSVPIGRRVDDVEDYVAAKTGANGDISYFTPGLSLDEVVDDGIRRTADGDIVSHGIRYDSLRDLVMYGDYYPLSADTEAIFSRSLTQIRPYRTPFLDNRLLDLQQQVPAKYMLRRDLVGAGLRTADPALADIPHAGTGVPPSTPFPVAYVRKNLIGLSRKHVCDEPVPAPYLDHRPWPDRRELLRAFPFAIDAIRENEDLIRALPFLDYDGVRETFQSHQVNEDNHTSLYSLLTLLEMPLTDHLAPSAGNEYGDAVPETVTAEPTGDEVGTRPL
jgi:asparagine synthase (glutamine-hydrolysing)